MAKERENILIPALKLFARVLKNRKNIVFIGYWHCTQCATPKELDKSGKKTLDEQRNLNKSTKQSRLCYNNNLCINCMHTFDYRIRILSLVSGLVNSVLHIFHYVPFRPTKRQRQKCRSLHGNRRYQYQQIDVVERRFKRFTTHRFATTKWKFSTTERPRNECLFWAIWMYAM